MVVRFFISEEVNMQILLIRHGQSKTDLLDVHEGKADFPLT